MSTFWEDQLTATQGLITAINQALLEFALDGAKQTVSMDTGQSRVSFTRSQISELERTRERLMIQALNLENMTGQSSGNSHYAKPGF